MSSSPLTSVRVAVSDQAGPVSRVRKQFNTLIKKLESERLRLSAWHEAMPLIRARADNELPPLHECRWQARKALVMLFDSVYGHKLMGKRDGEKLDEIITAMSALLLDSEEDAELRAIFDRYCGPPGMFGEDDAGDMMRMFADLLGVDLADAYDALADAEDGEGEQDAAMHARERDQAHAAAGAGAKRRGKNGAAQARQQAEVLRLQQSVRDIFRKLTSALHPDREADPAERARKTALMQRVNVAYGNNDLLGLLELQLEVDQIDQGSLDRLDEDRIKLYNKILSGQLAELQREVHAFEMSIMWELNLSPYSRPTPASVSRLLSDELAALHVQFARLQWDLTRFQDVKMLKAWLKGYRLGTAGAENDTAHWF